MGADGSTASKATWGDLGHSWQQPWPAGRRPTRIRADLCVGRRAAERACNGLPWLPPGAIRGVIGARGIIGARGAIRSHQSHQLLPHSQPPEPLGLHQVPWRTNKETRFVISISWPTGPPLPARRPKGGTHTRCTKGKSAPRGRCWRLLCSIALSQDASFETTFLG